MFFYFCSRLFLTFVQSLLWSCIFPFCYPAISLRLAFSLRLSDLSRSFAIPPLQSCPLPSASMSSASMYSPVAHLVSVSVFSLLFSFFFSFRVNLCPFNFVPRFLLQSSSFCISSRSICFYHCVFLLHSLFVTFVFGTLCFHIISLYHSLLSFCI
jgi:hypothetical protein